MLKKLKILIYENYFPFLLSSIIIFLFWRKFPMLSFLIGFLSLWYLWGNLGKSIFFNFIFLPLIYSALNSLNLNQNFLLFLLFLFLFFSIKKIENLYWLIFFLIPFLIFLFHQKILFLLLLPLSFLFFSLFFLKRNLFSSLIYALFFLELAFIFYFFPLRGFFQGLIFAILFLFAFKYGIIKNNELSANRN